MRIIFIGSSAPLSLIPFQALIESNHHICALAFDDNDHDNNSHFNIINSDSIQSLALNHSIPFIKLNKSYQYATSQIREYQPDIILVSCYARRLPQSITSLASKGCFNIHPSLLPLFRGPNPIFWQFKEGVTDFGVTLHRVTPEFDAGNIISQKYVQMDDGVNINEATKKIAEVASNLMLVTLDNIEKKQLHETAQDNKSSSYQSYPTEKDYTVSRKWAAKRIYNFINAYKSSDVIFLCDIGKSRVKLVNAYSYQVEPYDYMNGRKEVLDEGVITFSCNTGYIRCRVKID